MYFIDIKTRVQVIRAARPGALIGASTVRGAFNEEVIRAMAEINERPIIFALSNPTSKAECTAEEAYTFTNVSYLFDLIFYSIIKSLVYYYYKNL